MRVIAFERLRPGIGGLAAAALIGFATFTGSGAHAAPTFSGGPTAVAQCDNGLCVWQALTDVDLSDARIVAVKAAANLGPSKGWGLVSLTPQTAAIGATSWAIFILDGVVGSWGVFDWSSPQAVAAPPAPPVSTPAAVPLPAAGWLLAGGLAGLTLVTGRRRRS